ncbi:MAG: hypothetical protein CM15mP128_2520 [Methanobacteriota archaeon]|nr:MAG: hypothetical protein CM15mP128_2520 [Euryarchaeota archaeon]
MGRVVLEVLDHGSLSRGTAMRVLWASVRDLDADLVHDPTRFWQRAGTRAEVTFPRPWRHPVAIEGVDHQAPRSRGGPGAGRAIAGPSLPAGGISTPDVVLANGRSWPVSQGEGGSSPVDAGGPQPTGRRRLPCPHPLVRGAAYGGLTRWADASMQDRSAPWSAKPTHVSVRSSRNSTPSASKPSAGVDLRDSRPDRSGAPPSDTAHGVCHGRMDRNRVECSRFPWCTSQERRTGRDLDPDGRWRCPRRPQAHMAKGNDDVHVLGRLPSGRGGASPRHLTPRSAADAEEHRAWTLASPLGRSEYRFWPDGRGIDHDGHRLSGESSFMHLFAKEDFQ